MNHPLRIGLSCVSSFLLLFLGPEALGERDSLPSFGEVGNFPSGPPAGQVAPEQPIFTSRFQSPSVFWTPVFLEDFPCRGQSQPIMEDSAFLENPMLPPLGGSGPRLDGNSQPPKWDNSQAQPSPLEEKLPQNPMDLGEPIPLKPQPWTWQLLPEGLIYRSYLAGVKEPRCGIAFNHDVHYGWIWDISLGARLGVIRYGSEDPLHPEGIQLDFEGAALLRIDPEEERDLVACDYRYGIPLTWGSGPIRTKFGYYHLSSHLGDEFLLKNPGYYRDNYVRDSLVFGKSLYLTPALRFYGEVAWAFNTDGRAKPWEFQCGMDFSPLRIGQWRGAPFLALNGHWRQEFDYHGSFTLQTGWQWRNAHGGTFRIGMQYYRGKSDQWALAHRSEDKIGLGLWYDF